MSDSYREMRVPPRNGRNGWGCVFALCALAFVAAFVFLRVIIDIFVGQ